MTAFRFLRAVLSTWVLHSRSGGKLGVEPPSKIGEGPDKETQCLFAGSTEQLEAPDLDENTERYDRLAGT